MKKRLFAMFLVLVMMTVAVAACGKSGNKESPKIKTEKRQRPKKQNRYISLRFGEAKQICQMKREAG